MSDVTASVALRSGAPLVVIEAPAGCGKTYQGSQYAIDAADGLAGSGRVLILAHTHAACDVFSQRTPHLRSRVEVRTIDSITVEVAAAYHQPLGLPQDAASWARKTPEGYAQLATKVVALLDKAPVVERMLARRFPVVICDEHQDAHTAQHALVMALRRGGASLRIFGDPMQRIYHGGTAEAIRAAEAAWSALRESGIAEELDTPHRWAADPSLGQWILAARSRLRDGGQLDLTCGLPPSVRIVRADNTAQRARGYGLSPADRRPIDQVVDAAASALVLTPQNAIVLALRAFFNRRFPIWEGHVREYLGALCDALVEHEGDARAISAAVVTFLGGVCKGFSPSAYGDRLQEEVASGCSAKRRGKPATVQALGRHLIEEPNHRGVATLLRRLIGLIETDPSFSDICLDHRREYFDAIALAEFDSPMDGLAELSHRRGARHPAPPAKSISTIHKAKGLECETVIVIPCDVVNFPDSPGARRKLYVAMSRATASLTLVVPRTNPSPLLRL